jgi:hypothetical protein
MAAIARFSWLPGQGPLSKLFEGIGYFRRWYVDGDKTIIVPTRQKSKVSDPPRERGGLGSR